MSRPTAEELHAFYLQLDQIDELSGAGVAYVGDGQCSLLRIARPVVALVPVIVVATTGAVLSLMLGYVPDPARISPGWTPLYVLAMLLGPLFAATLMFGYAWARIALAGVLWALLAVTLASLPELIAQLGSGALVFALFVAVDLAGLRMVHGQRLRAAVVRARDARAIRYPDGFGLALGAGLSALLGVPASLILVGVDVRTAGAAPWLGGTSGPARLVLPILGVSIAAIAIRTLGRSRVPLIGLLGGSLAVCAAHAPFALERDPSGLSFVVAASAVSAAGLIAATRPRFAEFCRKLGER